jgi:hypothetical protein
MREGWSDDDHFILLDEDESDSVTHRYRLEGTLPGYLIVGLKGWDDFIVRDHSGHLFTVPTVPIVPEHLEPLRKALPSELQRDEHEGKIKWYLQPIVFGGSTELGENIVWVDHLIHVDLVCWWNQKYREIALIC